METIQVTDLYQASYLLLGGCELTGIECIPAGGSISCRISFKGAATEELTESWYEKKAAVNLWSFRTAYNQINSYVHQAKKNYTHAQRKGSATL